MIGRGLKKAAAVAAKVGDEALGRAVDLAAQSAKTLDALAERFAPLARRAYRPGRRLSVLEEAIDRCCEMLGPELRSHGIAVEKSLGAGTRVRIDPAELDTVILNLMTNSLYWMSRKRGKHRLRFRAAPGPTAGRVTVSVDDKGPGVDVRDRELVFRPGLDQKAGRHRNGTGGRVGDGGGPRRQDANRRSGRAGRSDFRVRPTSGGRWRKRRQPVSSALRVLVIDDEARVRTALKSELEEHEGLDGDRTDWTGRPGIPDTDIERWLGETSGHLETGGSA